jgi:hypothetical protein
MRMVLTALEEDLKTSQTKLILQRRAWYAGKTRCGMLRVLSIHTACC